MKKLSNLLPVVILLFFAVILCITNYSFGTFLSGWDTLHPEFNFSLNFQRLLIGVFRTEQGLGAVAAHTHMADLPRVFVLYLEHFLLPLSFLRYSYIFLCMIIGPLGMYLFLKGLVKNEIASFLGALFYLLNLGTMQIFNVPFEMFTTLYATIPFIFYFASKFFEGKRRTLNLLGFAIVTLFNSPSAYAATLWYVFLAGFCLYFFVYSLLFIKKDRSYFRRFLVLAILTVVLNLFWLLPNLYFDVNHASEVQHAVINRLFTDQAFLKNKEFGNPVDILLLKSFYFDWNVYTQNQGFVELLSPYIAYLEVPYIYILGLLLGFFSMLGIGNFIKLKKIESLPLLIILIFSLFFLINDNFPIAPLYNLFQNHIPFFKEVFRFPEDKIFNLFVFEVSIFFSFASLFVLEKLKKISKYAPFVLAALIIGLLVIYNLPSFKGNFINKAMKVNIPNYYFELFSYLDGKSETGRVANLPINSPFGWAYYNWNNQPSYQGAGFLYFGIKQPLLDRDFDRWSPYNESYYREMSYAVYKDDLTLFKNVLKKYQIAFVFIDRSVIDPDHPQSTLYFDQEQKLIETSGMAKDKHVFGEITIYTVGNYKILSSLSTNVNVRPSTHTFYQDFAYANVGDYLTSNSDSFLQSATFPFRDFIDNQSKANPDVVKIYPDRIDFIPLVKIQNYQASNLAKNLTVIPSDLIAKKSGNNLLLSFYPNVPVFDQTSSALPIQTTLTVPNVNNLAISLNQKDLVDFSSLTDNTPQALGRVNLLNADNTITIFNKANSSSVINKPLLPYLVPFFSSCDNKNLPPKAIFQTNSIEISGKGDMCVLIPLGFMPSKTSGSSDELLTSFQFDYQGSSQITACLFNQVTSECMYYKNPQRNSNRVIFTFPINASATGKTALKIFLQSPDNNQHKDTLYNFYSFYTEGLTTVRISKNDIQKIFPQVKGLDFSKITLAKTLNSNVDITTNDKLKSDCPILNAKKEIVTVDGKKAIQYTSVVGSFCDHFSYQNLPHNQGYIVAITSKNLQGLPLTLCITNYTSRRCDVYSDLTTFSQFGTDKYLLPPMDDQGVGYDINLENLGIKGSPSVNLLSSIEFIPIPYEFLQNVQINSSPSTDIFSGTLVSEKQVNPLLFEVKTNGNPTVLNLGYDFEGGWQAYSINCSDALSCSLKENLAPLFGNLIKNHVLVNNWSNGWILGKSTDANEKIVLIFVPQYFEYFGILIIIFIFPSLLYLQIHKKRGKV